MTISDDLRRQLHAMLDAALTEMTRHNHADQIIGGTIQSTKVNTETNERYVDNFGLLLTANNWTTLIRADVANLLHVMGLEQRNASSLLELTQLFAHEPPKGGKVN